jgi:hypothetical protein
MGEGENTLYNIAGRGWEAWRGEFKQVEIGESKHASNWRWTQRQI